MAHSVITVTNGLDIKKVPIGFSWTTLFFGLFVPLIRMDWLWVVIMLVSGALSYGLIPIVLSFFYNKIYAKNLFNKGYAVMGSLPSTTSIDHLKIELGLVTIPEYTAKG